MKQTGAPHSLYTELSRTSSAPVHHRKPNLSASLYVSNLPPSVTEEVLAGVFAEFGTVRSVKLPRDPVTGLQRCHGFVEMDTTAEARKAAHALNATRFAGRLLSVWRATRS